MCVHFATAAKPESKSVVVYHEPSGDQGFTPQRSERLLEDDDDDSAVLEWVFYVAERRGKKDCEVVGWHNKWEMSSIQNSTRM